VFCFKGKFASSLKIGFYWFSEEINFVFFGNQLKLKIMEIIRVIIFLFAVAIAGISTIFVVIGIITIPITLLVFKVPFAKEALEFIFFIIFILFLIFRISTSRIQI
jgi:hypothetical protein